MGFAARSEPKATIKVIAFLDITHGLMDINRRQIPNKLAHRNSGIDEPKIGLVRICKAAETSIWLPAICNGF